ncbi:MAG: methylenetetrahydrofolate reductase [Pseudomonadota bacterium]
MIARPENKPLVFGNANVRRPRVSFEFFPPKTDKMADKLWQAADKLAQLSPAFISVTYGAGGSTRERTHQTVTHISEKTGLKVAAHLTCVGSSKGEITDIAERYWDAGIRHIVALRGDLPEEDGKKALGDYHYAADLVGALRSVADFDISVAAYPEIHPEATSAEADIDNLKRKVDAGANRAITQFFFDNAAFLRFRDKAASAGISVPIIPGILPVTNVARAKEFSAMCGASVPDWFSRLFAGLDDDPETLSMVSATVAAEQCRDLQDEGVTDFHFYTLNRANLCVAICRMLGIHLDATVAA